MDTGRVNTKGRKVFQGPRGGYFVLRPDGSKLRIAKTMIKTSSPTKPSTPKPKPSTPKPKPKPKPSSKPATSGAVNSGLKNAKGRTVFRGPRGGLFVLGPSGNRLKYKPAANKKTPPKPAANKKTPPKPAKNQFAKTAPKPAKNQFAKSDETPWRKRKSNLQTYVDSWTGEMYDYIQDAKSGRTSPQHPRHKRIIRALNITFQKQGLRAPEMPPGTEYTEGKAQYLFRGLKGRNGLVAKILRDRKYVNKGYISTTRSEDTAHAFASGYDDGLVLRVNIFSGIPRGTPWIWFSGARHTTAQHRTFFRSDHPREREVLLPPGEMRLVGTPFMVDGVRTVDAVYVPAAEYRFKPRRKGAGADWNAYKLPDLF